MECWVNEIKPQHIYSLAEVGQPLHFRATGTDLCTVVSKRVERPILNLWDFKYLIPPPSERGPELCGGKVVKSWGFSFLQLMLVCVSDSRGRQRSPPSLPGCNQPRSHQYLQLQGEAASLKSHTCHQSWQIPTWCSDRGGDVGSTQRPFSPRKLRNGHPNLIQDA